MYKNERELSVSNSGEADFSLEEIPNFREGYTLHVDVICMGGPPGTGKSTTAEILGKALGIPVVDIGQEMRAEDERNTGKKAVGFIDRDPEMDRRYDERIAAIIRNASPANPVIITARLAPWILVVERMKAEVEGRPSPRAVSINLRAKIQTSNTRIWEREVQSHPELTLEEVARQTKERRKKDKEIWHEAHPELKTGLKGDPLSRRAKFSGRPLYDVSISTEEDKSRTPIVVARLSLGYLMNKNLLTKDSPESNGNGPEQPEPPSQRTIFEAA